MIGLLAVIASNLLCTCIYFILVLLQMTVASIYPHNPFLTLNLLAHIVDVILVARFLFKLNQFDDLDPPRREGTYKQRESETVPKEVDV